MEKASPGVVASVVSFGNPELWYSFSYSHLFHLILPTSSSESQLCHPIFLLKFLFCICLISHPTPCSSLKKYNLTITNVHLTFFSCDTHEKGRQSEYLFLGFIHHWFRDRLIMRLIDLKLRSLFFLGCFQGPEMTLAVYSYGICFKNICRQRHFDYSWWEFYILLGS